ncbi:MAG: DUF2520 domain-containing protein [Desulfobacterales bacterium]|nr:DUF2520 domain-containing protein [Desulfobacterales bacterium]MDD4071429.1 DUF2520 domain-containing protein [Desulfobacterales bacterium]MDD4392043.1 DUF2520 domain-containing protein [Desulfobacterales bacterium]
MKPSFAIIGCGKVGTTLANFLTQAGYKSAGMASKTLASARNAADLAGIGKFSKINWDISRSADIIFITTPDSVIVEACLQIADNGGFSEQSIVFHCSGLLSSRILSPARRCGAAIGSMHPLQSFASKQITQNPFKDIIISAEGDPEAVSAARIISTDLGAQFMEIKTEAKTLYHASAVVVSNYLVTLLDLAFKLIKDAGVPDKEAFKLFKPLIEGTLSNIENVGIPQALTGPIERGDAETIVTHMDEIQSKKPELLSLYRQLGIHTIDIATAKGSLSHAAVQKLEEVFLRKI